jgi:hypothetical protein
MNPRAVARGETGQAKASSAAKGQAINPRDSARSALTGLKNTP